MGDEAGKQPDEALAEAQLQYSDQSLHGVFEREIMDMLDRADLTDEQRQQILVALQCPCCGSGGVSISIKLKE